MRRREDLSSPRGGVRFGLHYDPEAFGRFSESIARYLGTARFLVIQTIIVLIWIALNSVAWVLRWDRYPFILLNLMFSTQAAYAAPLILLAQNRQEARDREQLDRDRAQAARTLADTEFLARELASIRISLSDVITNRDLDRAFEKLANALGHELHAHSEHHGQDHAEGSRATDGPPAADGSAVGRPAADSRGGDQTRPPA